MTTSMQYHLRPIRTYERTVSVAEKIKSVYRVIGRQQKQTYTEEQIEERFGIGALSMMKNYTHRDFAVVAYDREYEKVFDAIRKIPKKKMKYWKTHSLTSGRYRIDTFRDKSNLDYVVRIFEDGIFICEGRWERQNAAIPHYCKEIAIEKLKRHLDYNDPYKKPDPI